MVNFKSNHPQEVRHEMRGGKGDVTITKVVSEGLCPNARMFATITLPVGASIGYHVHENETELFCFVSGEGKVNDDGREVAVKAGDSMQTTSGHGHAVENTGNEPLVLVACIVQD